MRIALLGPFAGPSLTANFTFAAEAAGLPAGYSGAPLMTVLAKALVERGHEVAAITTDTSCPIDELTPFRLYRGRELRAYFCPQRPRSFRSAQGRRGRAWDFFRFERDALSAAIDDFAPDLIHAHWTYEFVWAALDSGTPTLATAHDSPLKVLRYTPNLYRLARYFMARRVLRRCTHLTAVSPDLERDLRSLTPAAIHVVSNPIAHEILSAEGCPASAADSRTLMMVLNGWTSLKNASTALEGFARARSKDPALRLLCFGSGYEHGGQAQRWATARGVAEGVEFRGPTPHHAVLAQMRSSLALLHPSRWEACCMAIAEAMSLGLPVIGGVHTDGVPWQLDEGRAGILVDVVDAGAIATGISALSLDRSRWLAISKAARARARELFTVDAVVNRYVSLYEGVRAEGLRGTSSMSVES